MWEYMRCKHEQLDGEASLIQTDDNEPKEHQMSQRADRSWSSNWNTSVTGAENPPMSESWSSVFFVSLPWHEL